MTSQAEGMAAMKAGQIRRRANAAGRRVIEEAGGPISSTARHGIGIDA
jgi:hypothetical protein